MVSYLSPFIHCGWTPPACFNNNNNNNNTNNNNDDLLSVGPQCGSLGADQRGNPTAFIQSPPAGFISNDQQLKSVSVLNYFFTCSLFIYFPI